MSDLRDFTGKNPQFTGTEDMLLPKGTTAERPGGSDVGRVRYNTDLGFLEQYNATGWAGIDAPPTVSSITGTIYATTDSTITITGSNFKSGSSVKVTGAGVSNVERTMSTTFVNSGELQFATNAASVNFVGSASFNILVTNPSGLSAVLEPAGTVNTFPVYSTPSGSLGTLSDSSRAASNLTNIVGSDADGGSVTFAVVSGSIPSGLTLNSNGTWSGTANAVGSNTNYSFTVRATDDEGDTVDRAFSITVNAPVVQTFTSGSGSFSVPSGVTSVQVLVVGGGGTGGHQVGGGGGAGGFVEAPSYPVTPGGSVPYSVGAGGPAPGFQPSSNTSYPGGNSTFGVITALGGGGGGGHNGPGGGIPTGNGPGGPGGSGGGGGAGPGGNSAGGANQGPSGGYTGYGNGGGNGQFGWSGGGGGGAGGGGQPAPGSNNGGAGGPGRSSSVSGSPVTYAGGGGGTGQNGSNGPGGSGGGAPGSLNNESRRNATFYGGGGGGARDHPTGGGDGFPGVVIVRY